EHMRTYLMLNQCHRFLAVHLIIFGNIKLSLGNHHDIYILAYMYLAFKIFILLSEIIKFLSGQTAEGLRVYDILFSKIGNLINFVQQNFGFFAKISFNSFIKTNAIIEEIFCAAFIEHGDLL